MSTRKMLGQSLFYQGQGERPLTNKRMAIKHFQHDLETGQVAGQAGEQVANDVVRKLQSARLRERFQMTRLVRVARGQELVHEPPGEPGAQVGPQAELRRRLWPCGQHARPPIARVVDRDEERLLAGCIERVDVIGHHERRIRARGGSQEMRAPAARRAPQIDDPLARSAGRELAHARQRFAVGPGDEIAEVSLDRRRDLQGELLHGVE